MTPQEVLSAAADHMEEVGLYKGDFYDPGDRGHRYADHALLGPVILGAQQKPCCALGAIYAAAAPSLRLGMRIDTDPLAGRATSLLVRQIGLEDEVSIPDWNDAPERTQEEVVAALRAAAQLEENQ